MKCDALSHAGAIGLNILAPAAHFNMIEWHKSCNGAFVLYG